MVIFTQRRNKYQITNWSKDIKSGKIEINDKPINIYTIRKYSNNVGDTLYYSKLSTRRSPVENLD